MVLYSFIILVRGVGGVDFPNLQVSPSASVGFPLARHYNTYSGTHSVYPTRLLQLQFIRDVD